MGKYVEAVKCYDKCLSIDDKPEVKKIKEEIETRLEKPVLKIELLNTSFILNRWKTVEMDVINEGDAMAKNVTFEFSDEVTIQR